MIETGGWRLRADGVGGAAGSREEPAAPGALPDPPVALTDTGTRLRSDAWKFARVNELSSLRGAASDFGRPIRLTKMPTADQLLEAIADWRKKRNYLQQLWDNLPAEVRAMLKVPATLD